MQKINLNLIGLYKGNSNTFQMESHQTISSESSMEENKKEINRAEDNQSPDFRHQDKSPKTREAPIRINNNLNVDELNHTRFRSRGDDYSPIKLHTTLAEKEGGNDMKISMPESQRRSERHIPTENLKQENIEHKEKEEEVKEGPTKKKIGVFGKLKNTMFSMIGIKKKEEKHEQPL